MPKDESLSLRPQQTLIPALGRRSLVGCNNFVRHNPLSDKFKVSRFHHVEFWCADAKTTYKRFQFGLGLELAAKSDLSTGNKICSSYVLKSEQFVAVFTAPSCQTHKQNLRNSWKIRTFDSSVQNGNNNVNVFDDGDDIDDDSNVFDFVQQQFLENKCPFPEFDHKFVNEFQLRHGLAVRAVGLLVENAEHAFFSAVNNGAIAVLKPTKSTDAQSGQTQCISEVKLYGDVVLRFVSGDFEGPFLANFQDVEIQQDNKDEYNFGISRLDHCVGNVHNLLDAVDYVSSFSGFHEFAEFTAEDVGTLDSGLNSMVLASNNEYVLLPINEPTKGTKRQSQIQTFLDYNQGPGVQHLALKTKDIFYTLTKMREMSKFGGFEFMPPPSQDYYKRLPDRIGDSLTPEQIQKCKELGLLVDKDDKGVLLQIFTQPLADRPTIFIEIIQRIGCEKHEHDDDEVDEQEAGCGGFGKGNFSELFKRIEEYEQQLSI